MTDIPQSPVTAYLAVKGGLDAIARAAAAGCTVTMPAMDASWGMRYGRLKDPFGHAWAFGAPLPGTSEGQFS